ncbi:MAG: cytochrome P450 [Acetobacteraceae bacterium]|nr:cytochrome P450 [Acetobacteraceae bacterium]
MLDTVRLWPTTPLILRETTGPTEWRGGALPAGTGIVIFVPYFDRDPERLPFADQFAPEVWLDGQAEAYGLLPFSAGPAACPGHNLVLLTASAMLARLLAAEPHVEGFPLRPGRACQRRSTTRGCLCVSDAWPLAPLPRPYRERGRSALDRGRCGSVVGCRAARRAA